MDIEVLEREALKLSPKERARLARELLESLEAGSPQELENSWLEEASHRAAQIDAGEVQLVSAEDVEKKARALLR